MEQLRYQNVQKTKLIIKDIKNLLRLGKEIDSSPRDKINLG